MFVDRGCLGVAMALELSSEVDGSAELPGILVPAGLSGIIVPAVTGGSTTRIFHPRKL
jgi:hypothetical protein